MIKSIAKNEHRFSKLRLYFLSAISPKRKQSAVAADCKITLSGVQHLLHLKSKSKILQPIEIMGFFMNFFVKFKEIFCCNCCIFISDVI